MLFGGKRRGWWRGPVFVTPPGRSEIRSGYGLRGRHRAELNPESGGPG